MSLVGCRKEKAKKERWTDFPGNTVCYSARDRAPRRWNDITGLEYMIAQQVCRVPSELAKVNKVRRFPKHEMAMLFVRIQVRIL